MTKPVIPLDIWANQDVVLENTGELNKSQPKKEERLKGWDMTQRVACEVDNFELHMLSHQMLKHLTEDVVPGWDNRFLRVTNNQQTFQTKLPHVKFSMYTRLKKWMTFMLTRLETQ
ncbi:hypothetical protein N5V81_21655 [Escherichia coli]|nr:hypothetical protein [Escherichia coli]